MNRLFTLLFFAMSIAFSVNAQESTFARYPSLNQDGTQLAFSFQGDVWTMNLATGQTKRLTIHKANDYLPKWSPDGKQIAFSSNRWGNDDVFVINAEGSSPIRITHRSSGDYLSDWTNDNNLLFDTRRDFRQVEWASESAVVSAKGGTPTRLLDAFGSTPAQSPNGRFIAFVRGSCRLAREAYRGSANRDIWIYDTKSDSYNQITTFDGQDFNPVWGNDETLYYISAKSGKYNVVKQPLTTDGETNGVVETLTDFKEYGVMYLAISGDGQQLAMEQYNSIFTIPTTGGTPKKLEINIGSDYRFDPIEHKTFSGKLSNYAVSPNGKNIALEVRGEIFITQNDKEKSRTVQITNSPSREKDVAWLNDSTLIYVSDKDGQYDMYMVKSTDANQTDLFLTLKREATQLTSTPEDESNLVVSPNGKSIAYRTGRGGLKVGAVSSKNKFTINTTLLNGWATPSGISWSPDSKWLAYSLDDLNFNEDIYIHKADNSRKPVNVSMHPKSDVSPKWSKDGSKLAFLSNRNNGDRDVWFVWLKKEDWDKTKQDWEEDLEVEEEKEKDKDKKDKEVEPIQIDFTNIYNRITQVTSLPGDEGALAISNDGEYLFFVNDGGKDKGDLYKIKWNGTKQESITKGDANPYRVRLGPNGKKLYFNKKGGKLAVADIAKPKTESRPFSAKMDINHPAERAQIFEEAWRSLGAGFYDPNFHGQDWDALKNQYKSWAVSAPSQRDFHYVFNLMLGQLNASHMGLRGSDGVETQKEKTGLLGIDIDPLKKGVKVTRVVPDGPADRKASRLNVGDIILTVNGKLVSSSTNFYTPFLSTAKDKTILEVQGSTGSKREVIIRPSTSISTLLYKEWVGERRKLTDQYSESKLGYLHIRGMNWSSFEEFERELMAAGHGKEGIVIDVRYNGGGWTTDYLMAVLSVKQHAYTVPRGAAKNLATENTKFKSYYPFSERLPLASWLKPSVAICNANSYSNAEIFSHAFKQLDRGTLVGEPTFGAVISTGGQGLIDGSYVRMPFRAWYVHATGNSMENIPAVPDVILSNALDSKVKGNDEQLKKAVEVLLSEME